MEMTIEQANGDCEGTSSSSFENAGSYSARALPVFEISRSERTVALNLTVIGAPEVDVTVNTAPKARSLFVVWLNATLRIVYSSLPTPGPSGLD